MKYKDKFRIFLNDNKYKIRRLTLIEIPLTIIFVLFLILAMGVINEI